MAGEKAERRPSLRERIKDHWLKLVEQKVVPLETAQKMIEGGLPVPIGGGATDDEWAAWKGRAIEDGLPELADEILKYQMASTDEGKRAIAREVGELLKQHPGLPIIQRVDALMQQELRGGVERGEPSVAERRRREAGGPPRRERPPRLPEREGPPEKWADKEWRRGGPDKEVLGTGMARPKKGVPYVYFSMLHEELRDIEMPGEEEKAGPFRLWVGRDLNLEQAVKAALIELDEGVKRGRPFDVRQRARADHYVSVVYSIAGGDSDVYNDLSTLKEAVFAMQGFIHQTWKKYAGAKHKGISNILVEATQNLPTDLRWFLRQDPEIESASHRLKGALLGDGVFRTGLQYTVEGRRVRVYGGALGSAEKLGHYIGQVEGIRSFDGPYEIPKAYYSAYMMNYPLNYFDKGEGMYDNFDRVYAPRWWYKEGARIVSGEGLSPWPERLKKGQKVIRLRHGVFPPPTTYHESHAMEEFIHTNFVDKEGRITEEKFGWKNIARMLCIYGEHDPRYQMYLRKTPGCYTIQEWFLAGPKRQREMYEAARAIFNGLDKNLQGRIIANNLIETYDWGEMGKDGQISWYSRPLLDLNEEDGEGRIIVDIGSLDGWEGLKRFTDLNNYYTYLEYAWRTQDLFNEFCQINPEVLTNRLKDLFKLLTADEGYRHLTEARKGREGPPQKILAKRQTEIAHIFEVFSKPWELMLWADRRIGRRTRGGKHLAWELGVNEYMRLGYGLATYKEEWESVRVYGKNYPTLYAHPATYEERVAKILGKNELKDAWIAYLKGAVGLDKELEKILGVSVEDPTGRQRLFDFARRTRLWEDLEKQARVGHRPDGQKTPGRTWRLYEGEVGYGRCREVNFLTADEVDRARIIMDEFVYRTIVYFAGFKIGRNPNKTQQEFLDYDQYGLPIWRTWFDFDFDPAKGIERGDGEARRRIFNDEQWVRIKSFLTGLRTVEGIPRQGALDHPLYSPFSAFSEKFEEDAIEAGIGEAYFRFSYDISERDAFCPDKINYTSNKWRERVRRDKKRWDMYANMFRRRRYTVGKLKGQWVISQLELEGEVVRDPRTGEILEDPGLFLFWSEANKKAPRPMLIKDPKTGQPKLKHTAFHPEEPKTPDIAWEIPELKGHDVIGTMVWGTEGVWSTRPENEGMGLADFEKQLTWEPLYYLKTVILAFCLNRYFDPLYAAEAAFNTGKEWEEDQVYLRAGDEEQREEFLSTRLLGLGYVGEDEGWVAAERRRNFVDSARARFYKGRKNRLRFPDIKGAIPEGATEEQIVEMRDVVTIVIPPPARTLTKFTNTAEAWKMVRALLAAQAVPATLAATGMFMTVSTPVGLGLFLVTEAGAFFLASNYRDKGVDERGKNKATSFLDGFVSGLGKLLGLPVSGLILGFGLNDDRVRARSLQSLTRGEDPTHDSALPLQPLGDIWFRERKENMAPFVLTYR